MSPATFAILTLAALVVVTHLVQLAFDLADGDSTAAETKFPSQIA